MARYIDAEGLNLYDDLFMSKDTINKSGVYVRYRAVENLIKNAPTADVQEVKHAHWYEHIVGTEITEITDRYYVCSNCNVVNDRYTTYCPWCGAKMDEEDGK